MHISPLELLRLADEWPTIYATIPEYLQWRALEQKAASKG